MIRMLLFSMLACTPPANAHIDFSSIKIPKVQKEYDDSYTEEIDPYSLEDLNRHISLLWLLGSQKMGYQSAWDLETISR